MQFSLIKPLLAACDRGGRGLRERERPRLERRAEERLREEREMLAKIAAKQICVWRTSLGRLSVGRGDTWIQVGFVASFSSIAAS